MSEIDTSTVAVDFVVAYLRATDYHISADIVEALRAERDAERQRAEAAEALAYIGDHKFPDLTWKHRCSELVEDLRAKDAEVARLRSYAQHKYGCNATRCMRCGCSTVPTNQHLVWIGNDKRLDHPIEVGSCTCGLDAMQTRATEAQGGVK